MGFYILSILLLKIFLRILFHFIFWLYVNSYHTNTQSEMKKIVLTEITVQELKEMIDNSIVAAIQHLYIQEKETKFLSRSEAAKKLNISLPTLSEYTKTGKIKGRKLGGKVMYLESELLESLKVIETLKYQRG